MSHAHGASRIDTHCHVIPPAYRTWLEEQPGYPGPFLQWSSGAAIDFFDEAQIELGILSVSTPGARLPGSEDHQETRRVARMINEFSADVVREHPDRFGFFATLTLPDVDGAIAEATYALHELGADGVVLMTNTDGEYLGSSKWDPLLEYLDTKSVVAFVHPTAPAGAITPGLPPGAIDFLADSVRAAVTLAKGGSLARYPNVRFILSHGGGYLPYAALRIARMGLPGMPREEALALLQRFYFDTAVTSGPYALPSLLAFAAHDHVTFGSDWPYASSEDAYIFTQNLDDFALSREQLDAINRDNSAKLFPRLASPS